MNTQTQTLLLELRECKYQEEAIHKIHVIYEGVSEELSELGIRPDPEGEYFQTAPNKTTSLHRSFIEFYNDLYRIYRLLTSDALTQKKHEYDSHWEIERELLEILGNLPQLIKKHK